VAQLRGRAPNEVVVLGMRPEALELGWELSPSVAVRIDALVDAATEELQRWRTDLDRCSPLEEGGAICMS
jgi:hydrogenase maturation protease